MASNNTSSTFDLNPDDMIKLIDPKSPEEYAALGGAEGIAKRLHSNLETGLSSSGWALSDGDAEGGRRGSKAGHAAGADPHEERKRVFGSNTLPEPVSKSIFRFMFDALKDKTLIMLLIAAAAEIAIGIYKAAFAPEEERDTLAVIDGVAIVIAVLIVVLVASINDYNKQAQFRKLTEFSKSLSVTKVLRDGQVARLNNVELMVGDVVVVETGDVLPADGVLIQGFSLDADESSLTGEPQAIHKDLTKDPFLLSGTKISNGQGKMLVIAVGINSYNGRTMLALEVEPEETPLQAKLGRLADQIAKYGLGSALLMIVILLIAYFTVQPVSTRGRTQLLNDMINILISAITLVVVAVPEGLPLAVTISLAHATVQMLKDNNLVRHLSACETMGNATTICSDKTGTLTLNRMTVVQGTVAETSFNKEDLPEKFKTSFLGDAAIHDHKQKLLTALAEGLNINSSADEVKNAKDEIEFVGSKTEVATLNFTRDLGFNYKVDRERLNVVGIIPFSSERKKMATTVKAVKDEDFESRLGLRNAPATGADRYWLYVKGASEIVLGSSVTFVDAQGRIQPLTEQYRQNFLKTIDVYARGGFRTLCIAFKPVDVPPPADAPKPDNAVSEDSHDLILLAVLAIQDPVRPEVPLAVDECMRAGITVRMVTGDNLATATTIAKECKILTSDNDVVMEGPVFRTLTPNQLDEVIPKLRVLARSSPLDKQVLVKALKRLGATVAVTGDGTNDAPALKAADVGFGMGVGGTEVAKEASDIVILDDNFASIVKAVVWGRSVYDSVRKFLQFQLTVNVSAVLITIITSVVTTVTGPRSPNPALTAVQLLWVNLIMDTLAALALATDPPTPDLLNRPPAPRNQSIISRDMKRMIVGQAIYQVVACILLWLLWHGKDAIGTDGEVSTLVFNAFVWMQIFNEVNARSISKDKNIFKGIMKNRTFQGVIIITIVLQAIIVEFGGEAFKTHGLPWQAWLVSIAVGFGSIPLGFIIRLLPSWGNSESVDPVAEASDDGPAVVVDGLEMQQRTTDNKDDVAPAAGSDLTLTRWNTAIRRTQMQIRVVNAFTVPSAIAHSDSASSLPARTGNPTYRYVDGTQHVGKNWRKAQSVRKSIGVVNAFRGGRRRAGVDFTTLQLADPARARDRAVAAAGDNGRWATASVSDSTIGLKDKY